MGRYISLSRIAKIWRFHVYTSVLPFQGLFQQIYTVLQSYQIHASASSTRHIPKHF